MGEGGGVRAGWSGTSSKRWGAVIVEEKDLNWRCNVESKCF